MPKTMRDVVENGFVQLIQLFNNDQQLKAANISFSPKIDHFIDRVLERKLDYVELLKFFKRVVSNHKYEIVYYCNLPDAPIRLNFKNPEHVLGFTMSKDDYGRFRLRLRTVVNNFKDRRDSRISTFVISEKGKCLWIM